LASGKLNNDAALIPRPGVVMRRCFVAAAAAFVMALPAQTVPAKADVFISVSKSAQRMSVVVDGRERYRWPVSTGRGGGPPSGAYSPDRMERTWYSRRYNWSPMPHAVFFHKGYAIHGTNHVSRLGSPASHGCVRLHPSHAAVLFALVRHQGMRRTRIVVSSSARYAAR
jgi:lipoprotein-anchoring transpeptidase ErfK/SrfK